MAQTVDQPVSRGQRAIRLGAYLAIGAGAGAVMMRIRLWNDAVAGMPSSVVKLTVAVGAGVLAIGLVAAWLIPGKRTRWELAAMLAAAGGALAAINAGLGAPSLTELSTNTESFAGITIALPEGARIEAETGFAIDLPGVRVALHREPGPAWTRDELATELAGQADKRRGPKILPGGQEPTVATTLVGGRDALVGRTRVDDRNQHWGIIATTWSCDAGPAASHVYFLISTGSGDRDQVAQLHHQITQSVRCQAPRGETHASR